MLSIATDYAADKGCPEPYLRRIADAGFSHVHWCHHWNDDFLYDDAEVEQIARWLREFGLRLTDLHGTSGVEKRWTSSSEYERLAGVALVRNRIAMTARLGADAVVMHIEPHGGDDKYGGAYWSQLFRSLDELRPAAREHGVRLAIELGDCDPIVKVLARCEPDFVGLCYDSGHGNRRPDGIGWLDSLKNRLVAIHLHDNDGSGDQHRIPFTGTVDWGRLMPVIAASSYAKWVNIEVGMGHEPYKDETAFLAAAFGAATKLAAMLDESRKALTR